MKLRYHEAIEEVKEQLHLADADAAVYVHLCVGGPAKASELASAVGVHRNDIYRTATRLSTRGLVESTLEHPVRYVATDPLKAFDQEIVARMNAIDALRKSRQSISALLAHLNVDSSTPAKNTYKIVQGRHDIASARTQLVDGARTRIDWATTFRSATPLWDMLGGADALLERLEAGVTFRGLVAAEQVDDPRLRKVLEHPNAEVRFIETEQTVRFVIADRSDILLYVVNDPGESTYARDEVAFISSADGFLQAQSLLFDRLWASARALSS